MLLIREDAEILRINACDRKASLQGKETGLHVTIVNRNSIVACIGTEKVLCILVRRESHLCCSNEIGVALFGMSRNFLNLLEGNIVIARTLGESVNADNILYLIHKVKVLSVGRETEMTWGRLKLTSNCIDLTHLSVFLVKSENTYLIDSEIGNHDVLLIVCHSRTGYMGAEGSFRNGSDAFVINTVDDRSYRTVFFQLEKCCLSVMIA